MSKATVSRWRLVGKSSRGKGNRYKAGGHIGCILYVQSGVFFDNLVITEYLSS